MAATRDFEGAAKLELEGRGWALPCMVGNRQPSGDFVPFVPFDAQQFDDDRAYRKQVVDEILAWVALH